MKKNWKNTEIDFVDASSTLPIYKQIVNTIERLINEKVLTLKDQLPSINQIAGNYGLSRDTVIAAYSELKNKGVIEAAPGKGYFVKSLITEHKQRIFLFFDEFNAFKEDLYNAFVENLGKNAVVDIFFHHFNHDVFKKTIEDKAGKYTHYVLMPANLRKTQEIISVLPEDKVYILDQTNNELKKYPSIYQNFKNDCFTALSKAENHLKKYQKIVLAFPKTKEPVGIKNGFKLFCKTKDIDHDILTKIKPENIAKSTAYLTINDNDLVELILTAKQLNLKIGEDIGIISYNETALKAVAANGITTISTDFKLMGKQLAQIVLNNQFQHIENPSNLILRNSL
ncbi:GntR family transcriptional regulator [Zhouia sp. PK063]|uniref:GntR family transcriptional regulator n=1 Tax=Zhouia sp. PK063 TaxID=3373602 RepID=UPI0037B69865